MGVRINGKEGLYYGSGIDLTGLESDAKKAEKIMTALAKNIQSKMTGSNGAENVSTAVAKAREANAKAAILEAKAIEAVERAAKAETQAKIAQMGLSSKQGAQVRALADDWKLLLQAYGDAAAKYKNYVTATGDMTSVHAQNLLKEANSIKGLINSVNENLGNHQHKVGQYEQGITKAMGNVKLQTMQLMRELPNAGISLQTFIMSLSNNFAYFFESVQMANAEIKKVNTAIKEAAAAARLKAEADALAAGASQKAAAATAAQAEAQVLANLQASKAPSIWKMMGASIFGVQGLLMVGVTLLTMYGKEIGEWVKGLFSATKTLNSVKAAQETVNKAFEDQSYKNAIQNVSELKAELDLAKQGLLSKDKVLKHYNETLGKSTGAVSSLDQMESVMKKKAPAFIQMMFLKAQAIAAFAEAAKIQVDAEKGLRNELGFLDKFRADYNMSPEDKIKAFFTWDDAERNAIYERGRDKWKLQQKAKAEKDAKDYLKIGEEAIAKASKISTSNNIDYFGGSYDPKKQISNANKAYQEQKRLSDLQKEIAESAVKFTFTDGLESEEEKIDKYFNDLKYKIEQFNKNPKNKVKLSTEGIEANRDKAKADAGYVQETKDLMDELGRRKQEYQEYEEFKTKVGESEANKRFKMLINGGKDYVEALRNEKKELEDLGAAILSDGKSKRGLSILENARLKKIDDELDKAMQQQSADQTKWLTEMLTNYASYEQKKKALREKYEADVKKANGNQTIIAGLNEALSQDEQQLDDHYAKMKIGITDFFNDVMLISESSVKAQIENIKRLLDNAILTPEQRTELLKQLEFTESLLGKTSKEKERAQLAQKVKFLNDELERTKRETPKAADKINQLTKDLNVANIELKNFDENTTFRDKIETFSALSGALSKLGGTLSSLGDASPELAALGNTLQGFSTNIDSFLQGWQKLGDKALTSADKITMAANFIINSVNNIIQSGVQNRMKEAEALKNVIDFQRGYNLALIEEQKIREQMGNSLFYKNNLATIKGSLSAQIKLVNEYNSALKDLNDGQIKVGTTKAKRDWARVGASTLAGAGTGALIGATGAGVLSVPGAIIGGIVGFIGGMLEKRKVIDVYDNLLKKYPDLIDKEGKLNDVRAKALLTSNLLDAKTKDTLQYVSDLTEEYKKAQTEIENVIKDLIGNVGNDVMSELLNDFKNGGEDAGAAFKRGFAKSLENLYMDAIYASIFGPGLEAMQERIKKGFESGDMNSMESAMFEFLDTYGAKAQAAQDAMKKAQEYAKTKGIDIFSSNENAADKSKNKNSLAGGIAQASQQSIDLLSGHSMGMKIAQIEANGYLKNSLEVANKKFEMLVKIEKNTGDSAGYLKSIDQKMNSNSNNALAAGL